MSAMGLAQVRGVGIIPSGSFHETRLRAIGPTLLRFLSFMSMRMVGIREMRMYVL